MRKDEGLILILIVGCLTITLLKDIEFDFFPVIERKVADSTTSTASPRNTAARPTMEVEVDVEGDTEEEKLSKETKEIKKETKEIKEEEIEDEDAFYYPSDFKNNNNNTNNTNNANTNNTKAPPGKKYVNVNVNVHVPCLLYIPRLLYIPCLLYFCVVSLLCIVCLLYLFLYL